MTAIVEEAFQSMICQTFAICQRQTLDPRTDGEWEDAAIIDTISQCSQVEALDEVSICEIWVGYAECPADRAMLIPRRTSRSMPQQVHTIPSPSL